MADSSIRFATLLLAFSVAMTAVSGCHVSTSKHGKNDDVDIGTPFGSMSVKTNDDAVSSNLGLSTYPGAVAVKDGKGDNDSGAADVKMSFGNFHLGVIARNFQTSDTPEKVFAFYRKDLARYGDVIQCEGNRTLGLPSRTSQGLTCSENDNRYISAGDRKSMELRSGSPEHQRIVVVENKDGGTRIALLKVDLPGGSHNHNEKESE